MAEKTCLKCGEMKSSYEFYWRSARGYHDSQCKACRRANQRSRDLLRATGKRAYQVEHYLRNRESIIARGARQRKENPEASRSAMSRRRVRRVTAMDATDRLLSAERRRAIRDDPCFYCGEKADVMHDDHVEPLAKGGTDHWWNLVRACGSCNMRKHDKLADHFLNELAGWEALNV